VFHASRSSVVSAQLPTHLLCLEPVADAKELCRNRLPKILGLLKNMILLDYGK
jgi:hypothetical protein